jgi:hypothetical protein
LSGWLLAAMIAAQSFDVGTSVHNFVGGCVEQTYFLKSPGLVAASKTGATAALTVTLPMLHRARHPKAANALAWTVIGFGVVGGAWNSKHFSNCRR